MKIIEVSGSAEDMGRAQGAATIELWMELADRIDEFKPPRGLEDMIAKHCPRQLVRMIGIARGANVKLDGVIAMAIGELLSEKFNYYLGACTAFAIREKSLSGGGCVIGKNFDYLDTMAKLNLVRISRPESHFASIDITRSPLGGAYDGVNEKGLAITCNFANTIDKPNNPLPISMLIQEALERFEATETALEFFINSPRSGSSILMIADREGDVASLELSPHYSGIRRPDKDVIGHTNHFHTPQMAAIDIPPNAYYSDDMPEALQGDRVRESSEKRYDRLARLLKKSENLDDAKLKTILGDHGEENLPSDNTICRHGPYYDTTMSFLIHNRPPRLKIASGYSCKGEFQQVELGV